jgi:hypothetical protein
MLRDQLRQVLVRLKLVLRLERRVTLEEYYQLLQLSEAIIEHGRMFQRYHGHSSSYAIVGVPELARCFRETPRTIKDALLLLKCTGLAEPLRPRRYWKIKLAGTLLSSRKDAGAA